MGLAKVTITAFRKGGPEIFIALFNPEEYTLNQDNNFAVQGIPGLSGPVVQFVNGNLRTLEMELFFDTWDTPTLPKKDVRTEFTDRFVRLMEIDSDLHAPPLLLVSWTSLQFRCVLARANQKFTMFDTEGRPVRARLTCAFNEVIDPEQEAKRLNLQTADFSKAHVVTLGENLNTIANFYYEDPEKWRPIAVANGIDDPRAIFTGQSLLIPSLPFIDPQSREVVS
jgi:contractile injection system tube protein/LysM domain-containing protein